MDKITPQELTDLFDQLVAEGTIVYGPHTSHVATDEGYPVCYFTSSHTGISVMKSYRSSSASAPP